MGGFRIIGNKAKNSLSPVKGERLNLSKPQKKLNELQINARVKLMKDGQPFALQAHNLSAMHSSYLKSTNWLNSIPEDAIITGDKAKEYRSNLARTLEAAGITLIPDIGGVVNIKSASKLPAKLVNDIAMMFDKNKGVNVRNAYKALAGVYGYLSLSVVGGAAAVGIPDIGTANTIMNGIASLALFLGVYSVRGRTTLGFQHMVLRALSRGPEYYKFEGFDNEALRAAGIKFDPTRIGIKGKPFEIIPDAAKTITVIYFRSEENVLERSMFGHLLLESKNRKVILGGDPPGKKEEKMYNNEIETVKVFAETARDIARSANNVPAGLSAEVSASRLIDAIKKISAMYQAKGDEYMTRAVEKFEKMEQGSAAALDEYTAVQFFMHVQKWQDKISALEGHVASFKAGKISEAEIKDHISSYFDYLEHKFSFDIVFNQRVSKTVDMSVHKEITTAINNKLSKEGIMPGSVVTVETLKKIALAIKGEYSGRRLIRKEAALMIGPMAKGAYDAKASNYQLEAIKNGRTASEIVSELVMLDLGRSQFRMGAKAGARANFFDKLGKSFVHFEDNMGNTILLSKADWQRNMSDTIMASNPKFAFNKGTLSTLISDTDKITLDSTLDKEKAARIIGRLEQMVPAAKTDKNRARVLERLVESFIEDKGKVSDFIKDALIVSMRDKFVEWQVFPDADFVGSYDKDYVPLSIDPYTGEYLDIFRMDVPMFKKWSKEEGRTNIALIQNPQDQEHYMTEGPLKGGVRLKTDGGKPLEPVAHVSQADQQAWYGAFVLPKMLSGTLNAYKNKQTGEFFLSQIALRLYGKEQADKRSTVADLVRTDMERKGIALDKIMDETNGKHIIESIKRHAEEIMISTGIGPGRGYYNSMFSCGTCELEYVPGMKLGYHRPYVTDIDGRIIAQAEIRFNPRSGKMEIYDYAPRYSKKEWFDSKNFPKQSEDYETRAIYTLKPQDTAAIRAQYKGKTVKFFDNKAYIIDPKSKKIEKVIWHYEEAVKPEYEKNEAKKDLKLSECRRVEVDYSEIETTGKIVKDFGLNGSYYESTLAQGQLKDEVIFATEANFEDTLTNLYLQREIIGDPIVDIKDGEVKITFKTRIPEIQTVYKTGNHSEKLAAQPVFQPDKWITEDMATTYFHTLTGWATEVHPGEVGSAVGPSDLTDLLIQHHRWFKGGPEVYLDFMKYLNANPELTYSPQGKYMKHAFLWPMHTQVDKLLYAVPAAYWAGQFMLPDGLTPLSTPILYLPMFGFYMYETLMMYGRVMGQMGNSPAEVWDKEAYLTLANTTYNDADKQAVLRKPLDFATTEAGDRKMAPYNYLNGMRRLKLLSDATVAAGAVYTGGLFATLGTDVPSPILTGFATGFNAGFPLLKSALFRSGINKLYGYWTKFDLYIKDRIELVGAGNLKTSDVNPDGTKDIEFVVSNKSDMKKALSEIEKVVSVTGQNVIEANGKLTIKLKVAIKDDAMYKSFERAAWVDGNTNFKHDLEVQGADAKFLEQIGKLARKQKPIKALALYKAMAEERKFRSAELAGKKVNVAMTSKEKDVLVKGIIPQLEANVKNEKNIAEKLKLTLKLIDARIEAGQNAKAANELEKLNKGNPGNNDIKQAILKVAKASPEDAASVLLSMTPADIAATFGATTEGAIVTLVAHRNMTAKLNPYEEYALLGKIIEAYPAMKDLGNLISRILYGIDNNVREELFNSVEMVDASFNGRQPQLNAMADIIRSIPANKMNAAIVRLIGLNNAEIVYRMLLERGN